MIQTPVLRGCCYERATERNKKTDVSEHLRVFDHVGLLVNGPPGTAELPLI
jgi:hypothetical protein